MGSLILVRILHGAAGQAMQVTPSLSQHDADAVLVTWYLRLPPNPSAVMWMIKVLSYHHFGFGGLDPAHRSSATDDSSWHFDRPMLTRRMRFSGNLEASNFVARTARAIVDGKLRVTRRMDGPLPYNDTWDRETFDQWNEWIESHADFHLGANT
jgi:hypothetical protein